MSKHKVFITRHHDKWRGHHNHTGKPKQKYSNQSKAEDAAIRLTELRHHSYDAYQCSMCDCWHVGGMSKKRLWNTRQYDYELELGIRVVAHMKLETLAPKAAIRERCLTALKYRFR